MPAASDHPREPELGRPCTHRSPTCAATPTTSLRRYDALLAEVPAENMILHLCLRSADGIVIVDTCPTKEVFEAFYAGEPFRAHARQARAARAGLGSRTIRVHIGIARGETVAATRLISARGCAR